MSTKQQQSKRWRRGHKKPTPARLTLAAMQRAYDDCTTGTEHVLAILFPSKQVAQNFLRTYLKGRVA